VLTARGHRETALKELKRLRWEIVVGNEMQKLAVVSKDGAEKPIAQSYRTRHDGTENPLQVGRRAGDQAEALAGGGLLVQGLGKVAVAGLQVL
jgi:hypothetical protein